jgi:dinuclear metal center YbgI/SA1388 family protein
MRIADIITHLETIAPPSLQESYDNSGLIVGENSTDVTGVLISLDCVEATVLEAIDKKCNLIMAHHPIVFGGMKRFNNASYVQRTVQLAIKNDIAIYAIHTNLDNVYHQGVNSKIAEKLGLENTRILAPKSGGLFKLVTYSPGANAEAIKQVLFNAGAGHIGNYSECSFATSGEGTFMGNHHSNPYLGERGKRHTENEVKIEVILRDYQKNRVLSELKKVHPYEEIAYEIYSTLNTDQHVGSGLIGNLKETLNEQEFLIMLKKAMNLQVIKHTGSTGVINRVALCGGSGQFLLNAAKASLADVYISADFKYHEFFDAENEIMICDIGHYESEKYTIDLLYDILTKKFNKFAVLKTAGDTNPVKYFL